MFINNLYENIHSNELHMTHSIPEGDMLNGERQVLSLAPWNKHDLGIRAFADKWVSLHVYLCVFKAMKIYPEDQVQALLATT